MDKSMTGDGAVVRVDHEDAAKWAKEQADMFGSIGIVARAYLEREAEIERLTRERDEAQGNAERRLEECQRYRRRLLENREVVHSSDLDAAETRADIWEHAATQHRACADALIERAEASDARAADLLKAARALLAHDGGDGADYHAFKYGEAREQLWLLVADKKRPAAKGETVREVGDADETPASRPTQFHTELKP